MKTYPCAFCGKQFDNKKGYLEHVQKCAQDIQEPAPAPEPEPEPKTKKEKKRVTDITGMVEIDEDEEEKAG